MRDVLASMPTVLNVSRVVTASWMLCAKFSLISSYMEIFLESIRLLTEDTRKRREIFTYSRKKVRSVPRANQNQRSTYDEEEAYKEKPGLSVVKIVRCALSGQIKQPVSSVQDALHIRCVCTPPATNGGSYGAAIFQADHAQPSSLAVLLRAAQASIASSASVPGSARAAPTRA